MLAPLASRLILAPMEGLADAVLRDVLTRVGGYDWCVTEFIRVTDTLLPEKMFVRTSPELTTGSMTQAGTPVRVQLLGSDPENLANNARRLALMKPAGIDLNFGCPAPTVNRHRGGAALLTEPELLQKIVRAVRDAVPLSIPVTAKMRLGLNDTTLAIACAQALEAGGANELVVHGRTKADGYRPPARWEWIARIRESVRSIPVIANGEVWTVADWQALQRASGCLDVMLGRGAVADPFLARRIRGEHEIRPCADDWTRLVPLVEAFWVGVQATVAPKAAPGRLKNWLRPLARTWPEASVLFEAARCLTDPDDVTRLLSQTGICGGRQPSYGSQPSAKPEFARSPSI